MSNHETLGAARELERCQKQLSGVTDALRETVDVGAEATVRRIAEIVGYYLATPITHGRHCHCSACGREDWEQPHIGRPRHFKGINRV